MLATLKMISCWLRVIPRSLLGGRSLRKQGILFIEELGGGTQTGGSVRSGNPIRKTGFGLGLNPTAEMAARAHDVAALALRGLKSCLNFADSAWRLPVPASTDPEDIQRAAAEAAEMFRPEELDEENLNKERVTISMDETSAGENQNVNEAFTADNMNNESNWRPQSQEGTSYYLDEEAVFDMPGLLNSMAEGLMLPPPSYQYGQFTWDSTETDTDMNLWNF